MKKKEKHYFICIAMSLLIALAMSCLLCWLLSDMARTDGKAKSKIYMKSGNV